ncbi:MAG TPA: WD40 repeat domain-containing protein [Polyangiales bacterium]|nr:WD40 repeat domain-containing protein [Polyangiales bacterium]
MPRAAAGAPRAPIRWHNCCVGLVVLASLAGCDRVPEAPGFERVHVWKLPDALVALDLSRDGQAVLLGSERGESSLWNAPWNLSVPFERADQPLLAASFGSDGRVLLARAQGTVELRANSGALIMDPKIPLARTSSRALFSASGRFLALDDGIYDLENMRPVAATRASVAAFGADRFALVAGERLELIGLGGEAPRQLDSTESLQAAAVSRDGQWIAAAGESGLSIWQGERAEPSCRRDSDGPIQALRFSASGNWLAAISGKRLLIFQAAGCERSASLRLVDVASGLDVDEDLIAVGDRRGNVYIWDVANQRMLGRGQEFAGAVTLLRLHAGSRSLLAGSGSEAKLLRAGGSR